MIVFESIVLSKRLHLQNAWTRHNTRLFSNRLYHQKDCIAMLLIFKYLFAVWFDRDLIAILTWLFSNQLFYQMNCICRAIDFQIRFSWTICSLFDFLSMSMFYDWYVNSTSEIFFFFLAWIFSQRDETSTHKRYLIDFEI